MKPCVIAGKSVMMEPRHSDGSFASIHRFFVNISMDSMQIMTTGRIQLGHNGQAVAANVKRLRKARGMSLRALSEALSDAGRNLSQDAINKIENGARPEAKQVRRVDVDDLIALAVVLGVSPAALYLPFTSSADVPVEVTGGGTVSAQDAWEWANGQRPLKAALDDDQTAVLEHLLYSVPAWLRSLQASPLRDSTPEELAAGRHAVGMPEATDGSDDG